MYAVCITVTENHEQYRKVLEEYDLASIDG